MTRVLFDIKEIANTNFTFGNVAGVAIENLAAKPTIEVERQFLRAPPANNVNGRIIFTRALVARNIERGPSRDKLWFVDGYIQYTSRSVGEDDPKFDDATINAIFAELESVYNVYNAAINTYLVLDSAAPGYNEDPVNAMYDFTLEVTELGVPANT